jgi:glycosyltransferase involved in cell wall biosynthesis
MISVIIPCYNSGNFVERAIQSVFNQTYTDWELILVNNNSTDSTRQILEQYENKYPSKVKVLDELKKGAPATRNKGLHEAKGEWIQFLDADDELLPSKFQRQYQIIKEDKIDVIIGKYAGVYEGYGVKFKIVRKLCTNVWKGIGTAGLGITSSILWKRKSLLQVSGWDENLTSSQEYDLMFRLLTNNANFIFDISKISALIYYSNNSITRTDDDEKKYEILKNTIKFKLKIINYLKEINIINNELERSINNNIYYDLLSKKNVFPEYVDKTIKDLNLHVSFLSKMRSEFRIFIKYLLYNKLNNK